MHRAALFASLALIPALAASGLAFAAPPGLGVGALALGRYQAGGYWFAGRIAAVQGEAVTIEYFDRVREALSGALVRPLDWRSGSRVQCNWERRGKYYEAVASAVRGETIVVRYVEDGVVETTTLEACREVASGPAPRVTTAGGTASGVAPPPAPTAAPAGSVAGTRYGQPPPAGAPSSDTRLRRVVVDTPADQLIKGPLGFDCAKAKEVGPFFPGDCVGLFEGVPMGRRRSATNALLLGFVKGKAVVNIFRPRYRDVQVDQVDPKMIWDGRFIARMDGWLAQREEILKRFFQGYGREYIWQLYRRHPLYAQLDGRSESSVSDLLIEHAPKILAHWQSIAEACEGEYKDFQDPRGGYQVRSLRDDLGLLCELALDMPRLKANLLRYKALRFFEAWDVWGRNLVVPTVAIHSYDSSLQPAACERLQGRQVFSHLVAAVGQDDAGLRQTAYQSGWGDDLRGWGQALGVDPLQDPEVVAYVDKSAAVLKAQVAKQSEGLPPFGWCASAGSPSDVEGELRARVAKEWPGATIERMGYVSSRWVDTTKITGYLVRKSDLKVVKTIRERTSTSKHGAVLLRTKGGPCVYALLVATRFDQGKGLGKAVVDELIPHLVSCPGR